MKNLLLILLISLMLFACKKEEVKPAYDNSSLAGTQWYSTNGIIQAEFDGTYCTEIVNGFSNPKKEYFLVGDKIYFYSLNNKAYTPILRKGDTMYWNFKGINNYDWVYIKKK